MKFRYKLMLGFLITLCISFSIGGMIIINHAFHYSHDEETGKCMQNYANICNIINIYGDDTDDNYSEMVQTIIYKINDEKSNEYVYLQMTDLSDDREVFNSGSPRIIKELNYHDYIGALSSYEWKQNDKYYYQIFGNITITSPIEQDASHIYSLCAVYDITSVYTFRTHEIVIYRKVILIFTAIGLVIAFLMAVWMTGPLEQLSKVVRKIAGGDIGARAEIHSGDEIEDLSDDINAMAVRIENDICELKESVEKQERFMGSFAHEMKTPMTSIIGYADLIRSHHMNMEEIQESANYIFHEGKRLESLSLKMLELIVLNNEDVKMKVQNPAVIINNTVDMMRYTLKQKNISLKLNCESSDVLMDADLLKSFLFNLIDNAVKSIDNSGKISVSGKSKNGTYIIQIKDTGRGMSEQELNKITEAFYRVDKARARAQGGAGLGLAICKKIAEIHNAELKYVSSPGAGTCVTITLTEYRNENTIQKT